MHYLPCCPHVTREVASLTIVAVIILQRVKIYNHKCAAAESSKQLVLCGATRQCVQYLQCRAQWQALYLAWAGSAERALMFVLAQRL